MQDKNGVEMVTGMVVRISNAYFKNDNGLYYIDRTPGDPSWCGRDYCMSKISKSGKLSTAKYRLAFWPLKSYCSGLRKNAEADTWNKEHAEIEVVSITNTEELKQHFRDEAASMKAQYEHEVLYWGENEYATKMKKAFTYYEAVANRIA